MFSNKTPQIARNKNHLRTIKAQIVLKLKNNEPRLKLLVLIKKSVYAANKNLQMIYFRYSLISTPYSLSIYLLKAVF